MHQIIPGILETEWAEIERKLEIIKPFSRRVHIDFLDGKFSPETSFLDPEPFKKYKDELFMEAHLMTDDPTKYVKPLADCGFRRFLGQIEKMQDLDEFVAEGQIYGEVGLALDSASLLDSIIIPFDDLDTILLMGVKAGKSGQVFLPETLEKIKKISQNSQIPIEVDGGINEQTIASIKASGATRFVVTSALFQYPEPMRAFEKLLALAG
jgi:ribulose-phosphate 3-epimerase